MNPSKKPGAHILIVDDEPYAADAVKKMVQFIGLSSSCVHSGRRAIDLLQASLDKSARPIDLVVLDRGLPDVGGLEVCRWIKDHPRLRHTPVLMLTASSTTSDKVTGLDTGADDYVTKPYDPGELMARIRALLRTHRIEKELARHSQQLKTLNRIATALSSSIKIKEILATTLQGVRDLLQVTAGSILFVDREGQHLIVHKTCDERLDLSNCHHLPIDRGLAGHSAQTMTPLLINDAQADPRFFPGVDSIPGLDTHSLMVVPLSAKDKLLGVLVAINKLDGAFTQQDMDLFLSMAASVAVSLDNARLFYNLHAAYRQVETNQNRLRVTANTLQAIFDGITDGLYIVDQQWRLVTANRGRAHQVPCEPETLHNGICYQVMYGRHTPCPDCRVTKTFASGKRAQWTEQLRVNDALTTEWELATYPIFNRTGSVGQIIVWRREVTEQRQLEASLFQAEKLAAVGQLAAGVAHEINNPLTAIIANAQLLKADFHSEHDTFQSADLIVKAGEQAARVVRRLLDFARQDKGNRHPIDVNKTILETLTLLEHQFKTADIQVITRLASNLPMIHGNVDQIQSIWLNLLINAGDALADKKVDRVIKLASFHSGNSVEILISDNGPGIPSDQIAHLFHPFYTTKIPGKGTGLGLSTSYRTVEQHGGRMDVLSEPGQGTTFVVHLPLE